MPQMMKDGCVTACQTQKSYYLPSNINCIESQKNSIVEIYDRNRVYIHIKDEV